MSASRWIPGAARWVQRGAVLSVATGCTFPCTYGWGSDALVLKGTQSDVQMYIVKHNSTPPSQAEGLAVVYPDGNLPTDQWGRPLVYVQPGPGEAKFDLIAYGRDGKPGGEGSDTDLRLSDIK